MKPHAAKLLPGLCFCLLFGVTTAQARQDQTDVALRYVKQNAQALGLSQTDLNDVVVSDQYVTQHNGATHIYLQQQYDGIPVYGGLLTMSISAEGRVVSTANRFVPDLASEVRNMVRAVDARGAVHAAARRLGLDVTDALTVEPQPANRPRRAASTSSDVVLSRGGVSLEPIPANLVLYPTIDGGVRLAWTVGIYTEDGQHYWESIVDAASGEVLQAFDHVTQDRMDELADEASLLGGARHERALTALQPWNRPEFPVAGSAAGVYRVYAAPLESPSHAGDPTVDMRTLEANPADPTASPLGWHSDGTTNYTVTRGNNVHAYTDIDANNIPDAGSDPDGGAGLVFDFPLDFAAGPAAYRPAAVTNLFYWNNLTHDIAYQYGFDEAAGNFQVDNFGNGGLGGDDVRAEAQDGSGTNNANFFTPVDGNRPRMQMFVWSFPFPNILEVGAPVNESYQMSGAAFGPPFTTTGVTGTIELVDDGGGAGTATDGCEALIGFTAGNIALIDRGLCAFTLKVSNAQAAGASAVVMVNNAPGAPPITMGGSDPTAVIPSGMITFENGATIKASLPVSATARQDASFVARDSDFDNGVIVHEYGHGISNRLTGGPSQGSCLANFLVDGQVDGEQMGEGWSDYYALMLTDSQVEDRGIGSYVIFEPPTGEGIRPTRYSRSFATNPSTYATIADPTISVPHGVGYVWATMLWDMTLMLVDRHGFDPNIYTGTGGNNRSLQLVTDGLKLQPCFPGFVDGRDAILAADALNGGADQCLIWDAFAARGLGFSADQGFFFRRADGTEAFDLPPSCCTTAILGGKVDDLRSSGDLNNGQHNSLSKKIATVDKQFGRGNYSAANGAIMAFINQVEDLIATGVLTPEQGADLISCATGVRNRIEQEAGANGVSMSTAAAAGPGLSASMLASGENVPQEFELSQNYPNPFSGLTEIRFALPEAEFVTLSVYDLTGREVAKLVDGEVSAGYHTATFHGQALANGVYFYRIQAGDALAVKQLVIAR